MATHDGPSEAGYHFVQSYQNCKRKHHYSHIVGLEGKYISPAILFGSAGHMGLEVWYREHQAGSSLSTKVKRATDAALGVVDENRHRYFDAAKAESQRHQLRDTFQQYGLQYSNESFRVVAVEEQLRMPLSSGDFFTGRTDLVVMLADARLMIMDHKFTGWKLESLRKAVGVSDQASAYIMLWNHMHPDQKVVGVIFNIIRNYQGKIDFLQVPVYRTQKDIDTFEKEVTENLWELAQRVIDPEASWPKNTDFCFSYNKACPFLELCQGSNYDGLIDIKFKKKEVPE